MPPDKATFETEFVLDDKRIHPKDDPDVLALSSSYEWAKMVRSELTNDSTKIEPLYFCLRVVLEFVLEWKRSDRTTLENIVKQAVAGSLPQQLSSVEKVAR
jgi:hypothetical protein